MEVKSERGKQHIKEKIKSEVRINAREEKETQ